MKFFESVLNVLSVDSRFFTENGELLRNKTYEAAMNMDPSLIELLYSDDLLRDKFFVNVEKDNKNIWIFDKIGFGWVINNKQLLPDSYTRFKNIIGLVDENEQFITSSGNVILAFPFKDCILEGGQTKAESKGRNESFYNLILSPDECDVLMSPKVFVDPLRYSANGSDSIDGLDKEDNIIISGNNLIVLGSIVSRFRNAVKMIYIDVPFNTGNDSFQYNDSYSHSTWLTFMKNRLDISLKILKEGGVICIHCDDNESAYLKVLCDEIFGRNNFINTIVVKSSTPSGLKTTHKNKTIIKTKDYIHIYKKGDKISISPQYQKRQEWDTHFSNFFDRESNRIIPLLEQLSNEGLIKDTITMTGVNFNNPKIRKYCIDNKNNIFQTQPTMPKLHKEKSIEQKDVIYVYDVEGITNYAINGRRFSFLSESVNVCEDGTEDLSNLLCDLWTDIDFQNTQNEGGTSFPSGKKPEKLIYRLLQMFTEEGDTIMDFFAGSGTTLAVAHKTGRKYIGVEQMDYGQNSPLERVKHVIDTKQVDRSGISKIINWEGGGSVVHIELKSLNETWVEKIMESDDSQIKKVYHEIINSPYVSAMTSKIFLQNDQEFDKLNQSDKKRVLLDILDMNMIYVNYSDIDDKEYNITEKDKKFNKNFYEA